MMGKSFAQDEYPSVFELEWNSLLFQLNITQYHWLYAFVDFDNKLITLHNSDPIVQKSLEVDTGTDQIIEKIEDLRIKDLHVVHLRNVCASFSLPNDGDKAASMHSLMWVIFLQELFLWLEEERKQEEPQQIIAECD
eukprot:12847621-Ditylum_brightwellii.AAC.1